MSELGGVVQVRLLGVPLVLRERSRQHGADLLREMTLLQAGQATTPDAHDPGRDTTEGEGQGGRSGHVPSRLLELAQELEQVYGPYVAASNEQMDEALDSGRESIDVTYELPEQAVPFVSRVRALLAEVERYCASDDYLLTLAPPPDIAAYRDWSIGQVLAQFAGESATPWPVWAADRSSR